MLMYRQCLATMDEDWSLAMPSARDVIQPVGTENESRDAPQPASSKPTRPRKQRQDEGAISARQATMAPPYVYNSAPPYAYNINSAHGKPGVDLTLVCATVFILITVAVIVTIISCQSRQISRLERRIDQILMTRMIQ